VLAAGGTPIEVQHHRHLRRHRDGHEGMKYSLASREIVADSVECMVARALLRRTRVHPELRQDHPRMLMAARSG
jgi:dihydroxy-acid dehydratase